MICKNQCWECPYSECEKVRRQKETHRRYYQKNRQKRLEYQMAYNKAHKEERTAYEKMRWERRKNG